MEEPVSESEGNQNKEETLRRAKGLEREWKQIGFDVRRGGGGAREIQRSLAGKMLGKCQMICVMSPSVEGHL